MDKTIPPSTEVRWHTEKQRRIEATYFRILFDLYLDDRLPIGYIAPHLRPIDDDPRDNTAPGITTPTDDDWP